MTEEPRPASALDNDALTTLFNAAYSDYFVPVQLDATSFATMVETWDIELGASRVIDDEAFAMLAIRGDRGWVGGMGVVPAARRRGLGERVMRAVIDEARARGLREVSLEVLVQNDPARRLYEKLGFEAMRELEIWELDAQAGADAEEIPLDDALRTIAERRMAPEPWQRADETIAHLRERGVQLSALAAGDGAAVVAPGARKQVLQLAAADPLPLVAAASPFLWLNVADGDPAIAALRTLGGRATERQVEMRRSV